MVFSLIFQRYPPVFVLLLFFRIESYELNYSVVYRWCIPCSGNLFLFSAIHAVIISLCVVHSILPWFVVWYSLVTGLQTFLFTRAIALTISLCWAILCLIFSSVFHFSLVCALSGEIMWSTCKSLALFSISFKFFFAPIILSSFSSTVVNKFFVWFVYLINCLINVILIRLPVTFIFLYLRSCSQRRLTSSACLYFGDHSIYPL